MHGIRVQLRGLVDTIRTGRVPARALAIADSRSLVRSMFLASAVQIDLLPYLRVPGPIGSGPGSGSAQSSVSSHDGERCSACAGGGHGQ
jgi:hypothetical protein